MTVQQWLQDHQEEIIREVQAVLRINSLKADPLPGAPFGQGVRDALDHVLALSERLGFTVTNFDNYAAHADLGEGEQTMGILGHLDVVPVGEGWTYPPFGAEIADGKIFARGAIDDKGPTIIAMYAAKAAQEVYGLKNRVRLILGCDEETGWGCMDYYVPRAQPLPDFSIVPDAEFPLIHAERGILQVRLSAKFNPCGAEITAGERVNVVPSLATAKLASLPADIEEMIRWYNENKNGELELKDGVIISHGVGAHGSMPELGKNAAISLLIFLAGNNLLGDTQANAVMHTLAGLAGCRDCMDLALEDEQSGALSMNPGVLRWTDTEVTLDLDIRHPVSYTPEELLARINGAFNGSMVTASILSQKKGICIPTDSPLVQTLMDVYEEVTHTRPEPLKIGGGTYARALDNAVAFGPCFPEHPGRAHEADEYIAIDDMMRAATIYALAIGRLCGKQQ